MSTTQQLSNRDKAATVRWPEPFWKTVTKELVDRGTTMQTYLTDLVCKDMNLPAPGAAPEAADDAA